VAIRGVAQGRLQTDAGATLCECPVVRSGTWELVISPHGFNVPGLDVGEPALRAGLDYHHRHAGLLEQALALVQRLAPDIFARFPLIRIAGLKPRTWGNYDDYSHPELPGSFIASVIHNPLELADHLIHEFQHNRLSCVEETGPLFDAARGDAVGDCRYYSPWRDKPRALYGLFHGVYVFVAVCRYWLGVHRCGEGRPADRAYVVDRLLRLPRQLALAVSVLRRFAHLTPLGQAILGQLARDVQQLRDEIGRAGLPADAPAFRAIEDGSYLPETGTTDGRPLTVREALADHLRRNDVHHQCTGLLDA
jgi:hypothetical protein